MRKIEIKFSPQNAIQKWLPKKDHKLLGRWTASFGIRNKGSSIIKNKNLLNDNHKEPTNKHDIIFIKFDYRTLIH